MLNALENKDVEDSIVRDDDDRGSKEESAICHIFRGGKKYFSQTRQEYSQLYFYNAHEKADNRYPSRPRCSMLRVQTQWYIEGLDDLRLIEYSRDDIYGPEAIEFAKAEIKRRNIDPNQLGELETLADKQIQDRNVKTVEAEGSSLGRRGRIFSYIGGCLGVWLLIILASTCFENLGHYQKKREVWHFTLYGFGTSMLCVFVFGIFQHGAWMALLWPCSCLLGIVWIFIFPILFPLIPEEDPGICSNCGYELRATPSRCPECGTIPTKS